MGDFGLNLVHYFNLKKNNIKKIWFSLRGRKLGLQIMTLGTFTDATWSH